jgi:protease-4
MSKSSRGLARIGAWCVWCAWCVAAVPAEAQLHRASDPVMTPASALVQQDDAFMIDINPAGVALLPAWSVGYVHAEVDQSNSWLGRGDALYVAAPLWFGLGAGLTLQSVRPGELALQPSGGSADRAIAGFNLSYAPDPRFGVGVTFRGFASGNEHLDGLTAFDVGLMWRPTTWLGVSLVGRDLFISREGFGTAELGLGSSLLGEVAVRPFGTNDLAITAGLLVDDQTTLAGRAGVGVRVPYFGTATALAELERIGEPDTALRVMAELSMSLGMATALGGGTGGEGFAGDLGWYAGLRLDGAARPGLPLGGAVLDLQLAGLDARRMANVALILEGARSDPRIKGVLLRPRETGVGPAYAQELRLLIRSLQQAGKPVVCHLTSASGPEYYACAGADRVLIDPVGSIRLMGTSLGVLLFGDTLKKIKVRADFVRIGEYKSAPEQFTQGEMSEPARAETRALLDDVHDRMLQDLATDLAVSRAQVATIMDAGPHLSAAAVQQHLVAQSVDEIEIGRGVETPLGNRPRLAALPEPLHRRWGTGPRIGVVMIDGNIVDGENVDIPFLDLHMTGGTTAVKAIEGMAADPTIRAIVVRVDSPGGAVVASDQIWRALRRARQKKPVVASMGAVAASGGYYAACAADEIWADPSTVTGSIGIFYGKVDVQELGKWLGVNVEIFKRGKRAGAESIWRPFTDDERAALADSIRVYYRQFLERVAEGRHMKVDAVDALARGRVYSGDAAKAVGLVDHLGGFVSALNRARTLAGIGAQTEVVVRPKRPSGLLDYVLGAEVSAELSAEDAQEPASSALPAPLRAAARVVMALQQMGAAEPLALMPYEIEL